MDKTSELMGAIGVQIFETYFITRLNDRTVNSAWKQRLREGKYVMVNRKDRFYSFRAFRDKYELLDYHNPSVSSSKFIRIRLKSNGARMLGIPITNRMLEGTSTPENKDSPIGRLVIVKSE